MTVYCEGQYGATLNYSFNGVAQAPVDFNQPIDVETYPWRVDENSNGYCLSGYFSRIAPFPTVTTLTVKAHGNLIVPPFDNPSIEVTYCDGTVIRERLVGPLNATEYVHQSTGCNCPETKNSIKVFSLTGELLFQAEGNPSVSYSVTCIPCAPGQLNCGDCCLSCADIFNEIEATRKLVRALK
ncbi:hypothetical protein BV372_17425 [Nostoc sp. T09]|uniref:hypothetical protein n=1 Tax=Nostoc sp. T09 TaxID=1932621 RepID=UPI000A3B2BF9|nr:hypothetical protein [Nostoc sp. T09]OUL33127.1 hypothetical protein BV372_17425 [Nostoc sp. T09]